MSLDPIMSSNDVVTYLTDQHDAIRALFVETLDAPNGSAQKVAFTRLRALLTAHEIAEETMVHPRVRRKIVGGAEVVDACLAEELEATALLAELGEMNCGTAEFKERLGRLQAVVLAHAEREEMEEFTLLFQHLGGDELAKLTNAVHVAERIASARPRAVVESGFAGFAIGPIAALVDLARRRFLPPN